MNEKKSHPIQTTRKIIFYRRENYKRNIYKQTSALGSENRIKGHPKQHFRIIDEG